jgi:hypothetical protein
MGDTKQHHLILARFSHNHPNLPKTHFRATSPHDPAYNCLAFAAHETHRWWHPSDFGGCYWPTGVQDDTLESWIAAYEHLGYQRSESRTLVAGLEKVAIFVDGSLPTHVARQLDTGYWTSKMGKSEDIEHALEGLEGGKYGHVAVVLERPATIQHVLPLDIVDDPMS